MATIDWMGELLVDESDSTVTVKVPISGLTSRWVRNFKTSPRAKDFRINAPDQSVDRGLVELRVPSDWSPESLQETLDRLTELVSETNEADAAQASASAGLVSAARDWWSRQR